MTALLSAGLDERLAAGEEKLLDHCPQELNRLGISTLAPLSSNKARG
jgi:hypothetical protein